MNLIAFSILFIALFQIAATRFLPQGDFFGEFSDPYSNSLRSPAASILSPFADDAYGRFLDRKPTAPRNALVRFG